MLVGKPEGTRAFSKRLGCRWEVNIKMDLKHIVCEGVDWFICLKIGSSEEMGYVNTVMNLRAA